MALATGSSHGSVDQRRVIPGATVSISTTSFVSAMLTWMLPPCEDAPDSGLPPSGTFFASFPKRPSKTVHSIQSDQAADPRSSDDQSDQREDGQAAEDSRHPAEK